MHWRAAYRVLDADDALGQGDALPNAAVVERDDGLDLDVVKRGRLPIDDLVCNHDSLERVNVFKVGHAPRAVYVLQLGHKVVPVGAGRDQVRPVAAPVARAENHQHGPLVGLDKLVVLKVTIIGIKNMLFLLMNGIRVGPSCRRWGRPTLQR